MSTPGMSGLIDSQDAAARVVVEQRDPVDFVSARRSAGKVGVRTKTITQLFAFTVTRLWNYGLIILKFGMV